MSPQDGSAFLPFHDDELKAQALTGQRAGRAAIRPFMPDQHREFFALLPCLFTATLDAGGSDDLAHRSPAGSRGPGRAGLR
jgi:predicted pyridoxine 5'-phosphate oxidase superfamily flavin-nucleotide-binding protein